MENFNINWKLFWTTCIPIFIIASLQIMGVQSPFIQSPVTDQPSNAEIVHEKLTSKNNSFSLQQKHISLSLAQQTHAANFEYEQATAYAVIDYASGEVIQEKNLSQKLPVASLTKIMTAIVALDLATPGEIFTVTPTASQIIPTKIGVTPGEKMNLDELLHAILLTSANDAAEVLKDGIDAKYGKGTFIKAMNEKARFLGLDNSHFTNPQGFDNPNNYSSAHDLSILSHYALNHYPAIAAIAQKDYVFLDENNHHDEFKLYNWNGLIGVYPNITGLKIGNTDDAGKTTIVVSERKNKKILVVVLGAPGIIERDVWASQLLNLGFAKVAGLEPITVTEDQLLEKYNTWQ